MQVHRTSTTHRRNQQRQAILAGIEANPESFGKQLVLHPKMLLDVVKSDVFYEMVDIFQERGLTRMLWAISTNVDGYKPARDYIRDKVFSNNDLVMAH